MRYIGKVLLKGSKILLENYHLVNAFTKSSFFLKIANFELSALGTEKRYFCGENDNGEVKLKIDDHKITSISS